MTRPIGPAPGALALAAAWSSALVIALLTGASAVVILLVAGVIGFVVAAAGGWVVVRRAEITDVTTNDLVIAGDDVCWRVTTSTPVPVWVELHVGGELVASGRVSGGTTDLPGCAPQRGVHDEVEVRCSSASWAGLVWWRRTTRRPLAVVHVGAALDTEGAPYERLVGADVEGARPSPRPGRELPDGVRGWRDGDEANTVHWPSSLRNGELVVRQHLRDADELWLVDARTRTTDADAEAARVRASLEAGLKAGALVAVRVDSAEPRRLTDRAAVVRWSAEFDPARRRPEPTSQWRRAVRITAPEPENELVSRARWAVAAAGTVALVMLLQPLGYGIAQIAVAAAATAAAAAVTLRTGNSRRGLRQLCGIGAAAALAVSLIDISRVTSLASTLRFLMPQVLVVLVVLQGFECIDRRSARVSLACAATITAYAAGVRVDSTLGPWMLVAAALLAWALVEVARSRKQVARAATIRSGTAAVRRNTRRRAGAAVGVVAASATVAVAILAILPVPRGPAQLSLPSWLEERRSAGADGELAAPDGSPLLGGSGSGLGGRSGSNRGSSAGSYPGFSPSLDTGLRGELGEEIVLRVKAPFADYWRGQTYSEFDGTTWSIDPEDGMRTEGPDHAIRPADGDVSFSGDQFIQTVYVDVDLPNLVFAATSARRVLIDAPLWQRADGALRAGVVIPAGSAYTVVSERSRPTIEGLRRAGDVSIVRPRAQYLQLPDSTTDRVRDLAATLAAGSASTYDAILAMEAWLEANVAYDLNAPVPPAGADAVDEFLFESKLGFCEQIATAMAIMLRSLGVPARVATGFVPSSRDAIAGVWISRAKDAHAWVEVLFPQYGWVAFDPTASVPLSGEQGSPTIGGELIEAFSGWISQHIGIVLTLALAISLVTTAMSVVRRARARRRRGRWGLLQDRFVAAAVRRGATPTKPNVQLADSFDDTRADAVARALDASAFAASWVDDDEEFARIAAELRVLEAGATGRDERQLTRR